MMDKHAIVIVTYNRSALLRECLEAVESQTLPFDRIVVVDNASTDEDPRYVIRREKENIGGSGGFAHGVREAYETGARWVTIIDDDAILTENFLEKLDQAAEADGGRYLCYAGVPLTDGIRLGHRRQVTGGLIKKERPVPMEAYQEERFLCDRQRSSTSTAQSFTIRFPLRSPPRAL